MLVHILEQDVADPSCMGKDKGKDHVVMNVHGCISACPALVHPNVIIQWSCWEVFFLFFFTGDIQEGVIGEVSNHLLFWR